MFNNFMDYRTVPTTYNSYYYTDRVSLLFHKSPVTDDIATISPFDGNVAIAMPDDASFNNTVDVRGTLIQSSPSMISSSFSGDKTIFISAKTNDSSISLYPLAGKVVTTSPEMYIDSSLVDPVSNYIIENYCVKEGKVNNLFNVDANLPIQGFTDRSVAAENTFSYDRVKEVINDVVVYVKTNNGLQNYTDIPDLLNVEIVDPIELNRQDNDYNIITSGKVHPTYAEPVMNDILTFDLNTDSIDSSTLKSHSGCNIKVNGVNRLNQLWMKKYLTGDEKILDGDTQTTSVYCRHNVSTIKNCWENNIYKSYDMDTVLSESTCIETGYEKNMFFASRGINLKGVLNNTLTNVIELTRWTNTNVNTSGKTIELDVTGSLINTIMNTEGFVNSWKGVSGDMMKYVKNSILGFITINNSTKFELYCDKSNSVLSVKPFDDMSEISDFTKVENVSNELTYRDERYYMIIKNVDKYTYYAKMTIEL